MVQFSYSRVDTYKRCPYKYNLRYNLGLEPERYPDEGDPLIIGSAMHEGIAKGVDAAVKTYKENFIVQTDKTEDEVIKFKALVPLAQKELPPGENYFEVKLETPEYVGYIDLVHRKKDGTFALYDFKYSNNIDSYLESSQIHLYKYYFEKVFHKEKVSELGYIFIPKTMIRQKKTEDIYDFRKRLLATLDTMKANTVSVIYDENMVSSYFDSIKQIEQDTVFERCPSNLCRFCDYAAACRGDVNLMALPKIGTRPDIGRGEKMRLFIYGAPFVGKTHLGLSFPKVLTLNTDGNIADLKADSSAIVFPSPESMLNDKGVKVKSWEYFKEVVKDLATDKDYETVVIDLAEDFYNMCRVYHLDRLGIEHESEKAFTAWDIVRTDFAQTFRQLATLNKNIVIISHEDTSRDLTSRSGAKVTSIGPNLQQKVANKIASLVDFSARVIRVNDMPYLSFTDDDGTFGGSRINFKAKACPADYKTLHELFIKSTK